jgi:chemotaxis protein CheD
VTEIRVKVADHAVSRAGDVLATIGLGSCIAIMLYDRMTKVGGMAHILLPSEGLSRDRSNRAKFPATAIPLLLEEMRALGAKGTPTARIVGGASMFASMLPSGGINMGERNIESTRQALDRNGLPLLGEDVGGDYGRSVYFDLSTGKITIRSLKRGTREL